ncbi:ornithine cyclodeaminase family protein [Legionella fairfieldensis]|uniref:ornithine cyclodeaminase family protein n=1 Tax=Legionella fairfieldensis TaxID=45064 RepID=UPI00048E9F12|nr:ornithine cyclodeaminase family protein [Legionella fairfieldensis]
MPSMDISNQLLGYKAISVFHDNVHYGLNPHQGLVVLLDAKKGLINCLIEGSTLTALRTAAVSAVATDLLSRPDSTRLALIGAGRQALEHIKAIAKIRPIDTVYLYSRSTKTISRFIHKLQLEQIFKIVVSEEPKEAVQKADIVVTSTPSKKALLDLADFKEGVHINAIGACQPGFQEINLYDHYSLKIYFDCKDACLLESDEIINPLTQKKLSEESIIGELGDCLTHKIAGRTSKKEITLFKGVGLGIEDVYAADYFYKKALKQQIGQKITL